MHYGLGEAAPGAIGRLAIWVGPEDAAYATLRDSFERELGLRLRRVAHCCQALDEILAQPVDLVVIDLRHPAALGDPIPLLEHLESRQGSGVARIALYEPGFDLAWADLADRVVPHRTAWSGSARPLMQLLVAEQQRLLALPSPVPRRQWVLESATVRLTTCTPQMCQTLDQLVQMASHDVTLLLVGETGTGKTTLARLVHELSPRREEHFLNVACGALPPDLIESELFGHVRGAFTGADRTKIGKFEAADQGTLLLDEIDVLGGPQQTKLLRVIETGEFEPVGSNETRRSLARLVVASNVDLKQLMDRNEFRADLYYRLNVLEFHIPPLRERPLDIVPLALDFIAEFSANHNVPVHCVHPEFLDYLRVYHWPGNIRELKNHVRRAVLFCRDGHLTPHDLAPVVLQAVKAQRPSNAVRAVATLSQQVALSEQEILEQTLRANHFQRTATARALGISRVGLYKKMKKYGLLESTPRSQAAAVRNGERNLRPAAASPPNMLAAEDALADDEDATPLAVSRASGESL